MTVANTAYVPVVEWDTLSDGAEVGPLTEPDWLTHPGQSLRVWRDEDYKLRAHLVSSGSIDIAEGRLQALERALDQHPVFTIEGADTFGGCTRHELQRRDEKREAQT